MPVEPVRATSAISFNFGEHQHPPPHDNPPKHSFSIKDCAVETTTETAPSLSASELHLSSLRPYGAILPDSKSLESAPFNGVAEARSWLLKQDGAKFFTGLTEQALTAQLAHEIARHCYETNAHISQAVHHPSREQAEHHRYGEHLHLAEGLIALQAKS